MNFIEELEWRGLIHDIKPETKEQLEKELTTAYIGFDPTADSLHIGSLVQIFLLMHFQRSGHRPLALVGGATGMIGDPSGKSQERNLLDEETLRKNQAGVEAQLRRFLRFDDSPTSAEVVNNYDWMKGISFLEFIRDVGKHMTVNYMMAKESVKKRLGRGEEEAEADGMSFTEFSYQLVQGYDFLHLYREKNCKLQMGGSDQWGNITTGTELIRRIEGGKAFAITCPLVKKADGGKFGKTETGNIWLDAEKTSPYEFYQFWINTTDEDAERYIKIFTFLSKEEAEQLIAQHSEAPNLRLLQQRLAKEVTTLVHSTQDYKVAVAASEILFGKATRETLEELNESEFLSVFKGVPLYEVAHSLFENGANVVDLLTDHAAIFPSKGELRRTIKGGGASINQEKIESPDLTISTSHLLNGRYLLVKKGKKQNMLIKAI